MKDLERLKQAILAMDTDTTEIFEVFQDVSAQTADLLAALRAEIADLDEKLDSTVWECPHCAEIFFEDARLAQCDHWQDCERHPAADLLAALRDLLAWANIQDHHSAQAIRIRDATRAAIARAEGGER
jgi:hypothetical protein